MNPRDFPTSHRQRQDENNPLPDISGSKVNVVYDTIDDENILRFSRLKNGSAIMTRQFSKDLARKIKNTLGERLAMAPHAWGVVSIGSSKFLGQLTAISLGLSYAHIRLDDFSLLDVRPYDAAGTFNEREKILSTKHFTLEKRKRFKVKNVILVDDMLNRGVSLKKSKEFIEREQGLVVAGVYVLFSIAHVDDASLEARISDALVNTEGISALIKMVNEEDVFVTRRLLQNLLYRRDRWQNLLALKFGKCLVVISKGFTSMSAKIWVLVKAKAVQLNRLFFY